MSEIEVPLEQAQEDIQHAAHHASGPEKSFIGSAAVLSAFLAVLAAISALFAGHYSNEAMILQIQSSDQWSYYQAKGIKSAIAEMSVAANPALSEKIEKYKEEQAEIKKEAEEKQAESHALLKKHESLATSVTLFQIAIAMIAIAVLTKKRAFAWGSFVLGLISLVWLLKTFLVR